MASLPLCRRPLRTILSLPDELLLEIFTAVKIYRLTNKALHRDFASSSSDIAAVRLTCRRFAAASSHLLVHYIRLDGINSHSLEKIEAVSNHPLFRKGVRIVRFEARCYAPSLAEDLAEFARWTAKKIADMSSCRRRSFEAQLQSAKYKDCYNTKSQTVKRDEMTGALQSLKVIVESWSSMSVEEWQDVAVRQSATEDWQHHVLPDSSGYAMSQPHVQLLREAHDLYRQLYKDQEELRRDNAFAARFAAAMSRMPKAKCLEIQDFHYEPSMCRTCCDGDGITHALQGTRETNEFDSLHGMDTLLEPMSWDEATDYHLGSPPAELLFTLPMALQSAGCTIESILVRTTTRAEEYYRLLWNSSHNRAAELGDAVSAIGLRSFAFLHGIGRSSRMRKTPALEDLEAFKGYITAMTSSDHLERFRLAMDTDWVDGSFDPDNVLSFGSFISSRPWRMLKDLHLTCLPIRLEEFGDFRTILEDYDISLDFLTLYRLKLVSGTWTEALEILRELDVVDKEVFEPTGAECDSLPMALCSRYELVFGRIPGQLNEAGQFINGQAAQNPLKSRKAKTNV